MALHNNLRLLFLSLSLFTSFQSGQSDLSPAFSPTLQPESSPRPGPVPSPSPQLGSAPSPSPQSGPVPSPSPESGPIPSPSPLNYVSFPPSKSTSPNADAPEKSDGPSQFDFSPTLSPMADVNPKVKEICDSTDHPSLCLDTVVPLLNGATDVPSVLEAAISVSSKLAQVGLSLAKKFAETPGAPPELVSALQDCQDSYDSVVYNFQNTFDAFPKRDIGTMNSMLSAVITNVGDCEDVFSKSGEDSPFSNIADRLTNMTSNCLAIISLLD
ncbi:hypothetical protein DH2020_027458 [Rehmannia glutinosa]|uniref:Pectinesterase inhibitor domain-containing protein n=1 Tax=Rehmannia glutinosa TaxID=99300 RepID=A0ABR0VXK4_REHGL